MSRSVCVYLSRERKITMLAWMLCGSLPCLCRAFAYRIRPGSLKKQLPKGADTSEAQYVFRTVRPADFSTPYDTLLKHNVQFTAVDRQQKLFITVAVRACTPDLLSAVDGHRKDDTFPLY